MRYGKIINTGILIRETPADGYKPIEDTVPETPDGYKAIFYYTDNGNTIGKVWEYVELSEEEKEEIAARGIEAAEALEIILGGVKL